MHPYDTNACALCHVFNLAILRHMCFFGEGAQMYPGDQLVDRQYSRNLGSDLTHITGLPHVNITVGSFPSCMAGRDHDLPLSAPLSNAARG